MGKKATTRSVDPNANLTALPEDNIQVIEQTQQSDLQIQTDGRRTGKGKVIEHGEGSKANNDQAEPTPDQLAAQRAADAAENHLLYLEEIRKVNAILIAAGRPPRKLEPLRIPDEPLQIIKTKKPGKRKASKEEGADDEADSNSTATNRPSFYSKLNTEELIQLGYKHAKREQANKKQGEQDPFFSPTLLALADRVQSIEDKQRGNSKKDTISSLYAPFSSEINNSAPNPKLKLPTFDKYTGNTNARNHHVSFVTQIGLYTNDDPTMCRAFLSTLTDRAQKWFLGLRPQSISSFSDFEKAFLKAFRGAGDLPKDSQALSTIVQMPGESTAGYMSRFRDTLAKVDNISDNEIRLLFLIGLKARSLKRHLSMSHIKHSGKMFEIAQSFSSFEDEAKSQEGNRQKASSSQKNFFPPRAKENPAKPNLPNQPGQYPSNNKGKFSFDDFTPLNTTRAHILNEVRAIIPEAYPMRQDVARSKNKHCEYHKDHGHNTEDCINLARAIQKLLDAGQLDKYRLRNDQSNKSGQPQAGRQQAGYTRTLGTITTAPPTLHQIKSQINTLRHSMAVSIPTNPKETKIIFTEAELASTDLEREQPLTISIVINNTLVKRTLADTGAAKNIIFLECLKNLGHSESELTYYADTLEGFTNHSVPVMGSLRLSVTLEENTRTRTEDIDFLVVNLQSNFNIILGIPALKRFQIVASIPHQRIKFPTSSGTATLTSQPSDVLSFLQLQHKGKQAEISTIMSGGLSGKQLKSQIYSLKQTKPNTTTPIPGDTRITFSEKELTSNLPETEQLLVTRIIINDCLVKRALIDTGAIKNIMFYDCFTKLGFNTAHLVQNDETLEGFTNHRIRPMGSLHITAVLKEGDHERAEDIDFLVVNLRSNFNVILGIPALLKFQLVASIAHQLVKFPTSQGVGTLANNINDVLMYLQISKKVKQVTTCSNAKNIQNKKQKDNSDHKEPMDMDHTPTDQQTSKSPKPKPKIILDTLEVRDSPEFESQDEIRSIIINPLFPEQPIQVGTKISEENQVNLINLLRTNLDIFAWTVEDMQGISEQVITHELSINPTYRPIQQKQRSFAPDKEKAIKEEVEKLLRANIIEPIYYPTWLANVVMVKKSNNKWRMCVDYTSLNKACPKDSYPLPRIDKLVDSIAGFQTLSFIDAYSGYHQIKMAEKDKKHTAFRAAGALYNYKMMPFGLKNAGATYQRMVNKVFATQLGRNVEAYIDDMVVKSQEVDHIKDLEETFMNLRSNNMKLNPSKCIFGVTAGKFLGYMVSQRGIEANPAKIKALIDMQEPTKIKEIQRLNGRIVALGRFIPKSADKCLPFFKILRGNDKFKWNTECSEAFKQLKSYLGSPPLLCSPLPGEPLIIYLSASDQSVAAVLLREQDTSQSPIYYVSKALTPVEERYADKEKLAYALIIAARKLRPYFLAHPIIVRSDSNLNKIMSKPELSGRLINWSIELTEFHISYEPRRAIKGQAIADFIAETTFSEKSTKPDDTTPNLNPPKERPSQYWTLHVDGASGPEGCGAGMILISPNQTTEIEKAIRFDFSTTNNVAEYEALIAGLSCAIAMNIKALVAHSDSQIIVNQVNGEYGVLHPTLTKYHDAVHSLLKNFEFWELVRIPRTENTRADRLSKIASAEIPNLDSGILIENIDSPTIEKEQVLTLTRLENCWIDDIMNYIEKGELPEDKNQARTLQRRAAHYSIVDGVLYRRSKTKPLLRCVRPDEAKTLIEEMHSGTCGGHQASRGLAEKVSLAGYYWPTLRADVKKFTQSCGVCQRYADLPKAPPVEQFPVTASWPFDMWGMDLIGPFPPGRGGVTHIIVAVDYFSKWIEAKALAKITEENAITFMRDNILCRFGIPRVIVSDHGSQFSTRFTETCSDLGIQHWKSSVAYPQGNGLAEAANKKLLHVLKRKLEEKKGKWADILNSSLWAIRTTPGASTNETPFALTYGSEAMTPVEMTIPTHRVLHFNEAINNTSRSLDLDYLEERRLKAKLQMENYKQRTKAHHDKKVRGRTFKIGDWVLRKTTVTGSKSDQAKLSPNWSGPFKITKIIKKGTYNLEDKDGFPVPRPWNAVHLKKYYH